MSPETGRKPSESTPQQLQKLAIKIAGEGQLRITVNGTSMKPSLQPGDALLVDSHLKNEIALGQIVTFLNGDTLVTHRVVKLQASTFILKGDNAPAFDPPIGNGQIVGRVVAVEHAGTWRAVRTTKGSRVVAGISQLEGRLHQRTSSMLIHRMFRLLIRTAAGIFF